MLLEGDISKHMYKTPNALIWICTSFKATKTGTFMCPLFPYRKALCAISRNWMQKKDFLREEVQQFHSWKEEKILFPTFPSKDPFALKRKALFCASPFFTRSLLPTFKWTRFLAGWVKKPWLAHDSWSLSILSIKIMMILFVVCGTPSDCPDWLQANNRRGVLLGPLINEMT